MQQPTNDRLIPLWQRLGVLALVVVNVLFVVLDWSRFTADFWPLDHSNVGPNLVASVVQWELVLIAAVLLLPAARRWVKRAAEQTLKPLHDKLDTHHVELMKQAAEHHRLALRLSQDQHAALLRRGEEHHQALLKQAAEHHEALLKHVTATVGAPVKAASRPKA